MPKPYRSELLEAGPRKRGRPRGRWMPKHPKVVIYARFSPRPDSDQCDSCDKQISYLRDFCERRTWFPAGERTFQDDNLSGGDWDRVGIFEAIRACKRGWVLLVYNWERLGRDTLFNLLVANKLRRAGVVLYSATEGPFEDDTDPNRLLMATIISAFAEFQRRTSATRTSVQMKRHVKNGRMMGSVPPIGFELDPDSPPHPESGRPSRMRPCPEEQRQVERLKHCFELGWSFRKIARYMNAQDRPIRGKAWYHHTVRRALEFAGISRAG